MMSGAAMVVEALKDVGVKHVFGYPGGAVLDIYDALFAQEDVKHVLVRHEQAAAHMADGYARVTGKVGICEGPSGGGATYIIPGVVEANESSISVISFTSDVPTTSYGHFPLTELDQKALFKPLTKWNCVLSKPKNYKTTKNLLFFITKTNIMRVFF